MPVAAHPNARRSLDFVFDGFEKLTQPNTCTARQLQRADIRAPVDGYAHDMHIVTSDFATLNAAASRNGRFAISVAILADRLDAGSIRKSQLDDAKLTLNRVFERCWDQEVGQLFFHAGRWEEQPAEVYELYSSIDHYSLHRVPAGLKKIEKAGLDGEPVRRMRAILQEALPLSQAFEDLKAMIVKGRAPAAPKVENPNKITGTCSCCMRDIAIAHGGGGMAHHGFKRPGWGVQTSSCSGIKFPPLEVSTEGLEWLISNTRERVTNRMDLLQKLESDTVNEIFLEVRVKGVRTLKKFKREDEGFQQARRRRAREVDGETYMIKRHLEDLCPQLDKWQAFHLEKDCAKKGVDTASEDPQP